MANLDADRVVQQFVVAATEKLDTDRVIQQFVVGATPKLDVDRVIIQYLVFNRDLEPSTGTDVLFFGCNI